METVTIAFLGIGGFALVLLLLSLVGGFVDLGDMHLGHGGDLSVDGHPGGGFQLTLPAIAGFLGAFGFAGAAASSVWSGSGVASAAVGVVVGLCAGVPMAWMAGRLVRAAMNMRTDATPDSGDLVGAMGVVVTSVAEGGYGEVQVTVAGHKMKLNARATRPLERGTEILVIGVPSPTSVLVEPLPDGLSPS